MDRDTNLRQFLQKVAQAGIVVELNGDKLNVSGPNNPELIAGIKQQKAGIVELIENIPYETIEEHYGARLKKGNQLLEEALDGIEKNPDDVKLKFLLFKHMGRWDSIDEELRRIYPEYMQCPVGGCAPDAVVCCQHCIHERMREYEAV